MHDSIKEIDVFLYAHRMILIYTYGMRLIRALTQTHHLIIRDFFKSLMAFFLVLLSF